MSSTEISTETHRVAINPAECAAIEAHDGVQPGGPGEPVAGDPEDFAELVGADVASGVGTALLFWPEGEFERIAGECPPLATALGGTWDEHRAGIERGFAQLSEHGRSGLIVLTGVFAELADLASSRGTDPGDLDTLRAYVDTVEGDRREASWPPGRNADCWCGSRLKYKKCCHRRTR